MLEAESQKVREKARTCLQEVHALLGLFAFTDFLLPDCVSYITFGSC